MRRFLAFIIPFSALTLPMPLMALTLLPTCADSGNCYTCDFLVLFVNWSQLTLYGLTGMAVLMIAIAGFLWVLSAGRAEMVQKGRQIIVGTVIGLMFAFLGYTIVNVSIAALLGADFSEVQLFGTDWSEFCEGGLTPGGAATDCSASSGAVDGNACANASCPDEGVCVCSSGVCMSKCDYQVPLFSAMGTTVSTSCLDTAEECSSGIADSGYCTEGRFCCTVIP